LEEELSVNFGQKYYFQNLEAKAIACRAAAKAARASNVKFIYQIVQAYPGNESSGLYKFLASSAASHFDILSLHVYAWPDFPSPETFVPQLINTTNQWMKDLNQVKPIWYTESGIPVNDPPVQGFEDGGHPVTGSTKINAANFMVKLHTLSFSLGVERIFWYNYANGFLSRTDAEGNFGMFDYYGYPFPMAAAQWNMVATIDDKQFISHDILPGNIHSFHFQGPNNHAYILWTYPSTTSIVSLSLIQPSLLPTQILCTDATARPCTQLQTDSITITSEPVFLLTTN